MKITGTSFSDILAFSWHMNLAWLSVLFNPRGAKTTSCAPSQVLLIADCVVRVAVHTKLNRMCNTPWRLPTTETWLRLGRLAGGRGWSSSPCHGRLWGAGMTRQWPRWRSWPLPRQGRRGRIGARSSGTFIRSFLSFLPGEMQLCCWTGSQPFPSPDIDGVREVLHSYYIQNYLKLCNHSSQCLQTVIMQSF